MSTDIIAIFIVVRNESKLLNQLVSTLALRSRATSNNMDKMPMAKIKLDLSHLQIKSAYDPDLGSESI
jgi:hypothetical protein